jgi:hypothetical protein
MTGKQYCFSDVFLNVCDVYLDVSTCKEYSSAIFPKNVFANFDTSDYDAREDVVIMRRTSLEESNEGQPIGKRDKDFSGAHDSRRPQLVQALDDDIDDTTALQNAEIKAKGIFRSEQNRKTAGERKFADFSSLCRCTAWSMDSASSEKGEQHALRSWDSSTVDRVHWDEIVYDSRDLKTKLKLSRV